MAFLPILIVFLLYFTGIPIAYALFGSSLTYFSFINDASAPDLILQRYITSAQNFSLLAIPFFIMAGSIMNYSGISSKLMKFAEVLTGHMTGGLGQVNVLLSLLMGGVSGSANADAAMQSKMLVPEMEKRGYSRAFSAAITAASSAVTPVIPPGINLIVYGLIAQVSVGAMFMAGYVPGVLMAISLMIVVYIISKKRGYTPTREKRATAREIFKQTLESIWALLFPFGIIAGLRIGLFTPSEAGAVAVLYTILVGFFIYKELKIEHFKDILKDTVYGTSSVVLIIIAANVFGYYMSWERIPQMLTEMMLGITENPMLMLLMINIFYLILGMFIEGGAALIILSPLLVPVVTQMGVDPIHFGMITIVNIMIGGITPPFGSMMFTVCTITNTKVGAFMKEIWPFILALLVVLLIITYFPGIVMFVPNLVF
ncbi:TRAP transporter large permease [Proteiniclasticum sp. SCR006]|uniref:TRAP transporter large permease n=1 Tax=Proteiniclasticum aestuarii TaxID=2817862 RepID=A0A939KLX6_9CLOT|nr:TRAP transporter large permease [Proteiniclasticum aestuarii]MBO1266130.1 TRAP transporter large permease [Proteiniclasticum aestuarii]